MVAAATAPHAAHRAGEPGGVRGTSQTAAATIAARTGTMSQSRGPGGGAGFVTAGMAVGAPQR